MPKPETPPNGNGSRIWWVDLLRREGVLTALVVLYAVFIAIPESQCRRDALEKSQMTMAQVADAVKAIQSAEALQAQAAVETTAFRRQAEKDHQQQTVDHQALRDAVGRLRPPG